MIRLQKIMTSVLLADVLYYLSSFQVLMKKIAMRERLLWGKEWRVASGRQAARNWDCQHTSHWGNAANKCLVSLEADPSPGEASDETADPEPTL